MQDVVFGYISIESDPQAEIFLDGDFVGMTPVERIKVKEGLHTVELKKQGYEPWSRSLKVISDSNIPLSVVLEKEAYVDENWKVE